MHYVYTVIEVYQLHYLFSWMSFSRWMISVICTYDRYWHYIHCI